MSPIIILPNVIPDCGPDYASLVLADSPMGYWKLNDSGATAVDSSGNGRNGTFTITCGSQQQPGPFPCSPSVTSFDSICGTGNYITVPDNAFDSVIGAPNQSWTYEIWMWDNSSILFQALIDKTDISGPANWNIMQMRSGTGKVNFQLYDGTNNPLVDGTTGVANSTWHHVVCARATVAGGDGADELRVYVDGTLENSVAASGTIDTQNSIDLTIGSREAGSDRFAHTQYAQAAVYNYALPLARVQAHWNNGWI